MTTAIKTSQLLSARIRMPLAGAWVGDFVLDSPSVSGQVSIDTGGPGGLVLVGTVVDSGTVEEITTARVVGGRGGLSTVIAGKDYSDCPLRIVLADLLGAAGEELDDSSPTEGLDTDLPRWTTKPGTVATALDELAKAIGDFAVWRVLPSGKIRFGLEAWPEVNPDYVLIDSDPAHGRMTLAPEALTVQPGTVLRSKAITDVEHLIDGRTIRSELRYGAKTTDTDRLKGALRALVRHWQAPLDRFALYPAEVVAQEPQGGALSVRPFDERMPPISGVKIRHGIPGVNVEVEPGARVLVGFEAGDPELPYASLWEEGSLKRLYIEATGQVVIQCPDVLLGDKKNARPVARIGDPVQLLLDPTTVVQGTVGGALFAGSLVLPGVMYGFVAGGGEVKSA
jgi:hypothetical protein